MIDGTHGSQEKDHYQSIWKLVDAEMAECKDSSGAFKPGRQEPYEALERVKAGLETELDKIMENEIQAAKSKGKPIIKPVETLQLAILGTEARPGSMTILRGITNSDKYAEVKLIVAGGANARVTGVVIENPVDGSKETFGDLTKVRERVALTYQNSGNHEAAKQIRENMTDREFGSLLTNHTKGLAIDYAHERAGGRTTAMVYVSKWLLGGSLAIAGLALSPGKEAGAPRRVPIVEDGLMPKP